MPFQVFFVFVFCIRLTEAKQNIPQGKCLSFKWEKEDDEINYICCNNCGEENQNCVGKTFGATEGYCNNCGRDNMNSAQKISIPYSCGSCSGQTRAANTCKKLYTKLPVGCWLFRACFENVCQNVGTCFNGVCEKNEYIESCPADCCVKRNPQKCTLLPGLCLPQCCGENNCCLETEENNSVKMTLIYVAVCIGCVSIGCLLYKICGYIKNRVDPE